MAKSSKAATESPLSIADQIEQQQILREYRQAIAKRERGDRLTQRDLQAIERFSDQQARVHGERYMQTMPKKDFQTATGVTRETFLRWHNQFGFPYIPRQRTINAWQAIHWLIEQFKHGRSVQGQAPQTEEEILLGGASDELKNEFLRERIMEKRILNADRKIALEEKREKYLPIEPVVAAHDFLAERIRVTRESLARQFDGGDRERVEQAFDDLIDDYLQEIETRFGNDSASGNDAPD